MLRCFLAWATTSLPKTITGAREYGPWYWVIAFFWNWQCFVTIKLYYYLLYFKIKKLVFFSGKGWMQYFIRFMKVTKKFMHALRNLMGSSLAYASPSTNFHEKWANTFLVIQLSNRLNQKQHLWWRLLKQSNQFQVHHLKNGYSMTKPNVRIKSCILKRSTKWPSLQWFDIKQNVSQRLD